MGNLANDPDPATIQMVARIADGLVSRNQAIRRHRDDLVQEGLFGIWQSRATGPEPLLAVIARRRMIDWLRAESGRLGSPRMASLYRTSSLDERIATTSDLSLVDMIPDPGPDPYQQVEDRSMLAWVVAQLPRLKPRHREVVVGFLREAPLSEIAARWKVSESRVSQVAGDARHALLHRNCPHRASRCSRGKR